MKTIFISPKLITRIQKRVDKFAKRWDYEGNDLFQLWQMIATIEISKAEKIFYDKDESDYEGIVCDGWNGYQPGSYGHKNTDVDPHSAWGGFYRHEPGQMAGWSVYMIAQANDKIAQANRCTSAYDWWFHWEPVEMVWGFVGWQEYYTEEEARLVKSAYRLAKRVSVEYSDMSGMWRVRVETTRQKPALKNIWRERIVK